uniref:Uncharacterized protein n=1 Tax=Lactuca sativa TaxID=4236 RepID=A0A9R1WBZ0_LACSA|nr:hypothetical protein LSAT_V11C200066870 [Lactuca sativa]
MITTLKKCRFFEWKDEEHEEDAKEDMSEMNNLRRMIVEVEFLLSQRHSKVAKSEKDVFDARKAIGMYRMIVALLFSYLVFCVLKLGGNILS